VVGSPSNQKFDGVAFDQKRGGGAPQKSRLGTPPPERRRGLGQKLKTWGEAYTGADNEKELLYALNRIQKERYATRQNMKNKSSSEDPQMGEETKKRTGVLLAR